MRLLGSQWAATHPHQEREVSGEKTRDVMPNETVTVTLTGTEARFIFSNMGMINPRSAALGRSIQEKLRAVGIKDGFNVVPGER